MVVQSLCFFSAVQFYNGANALKVYGIIHRSSLSALSIRFCADKVEIYNFKLQLDE